MALRRVRASDIRGLTAWLPAVGSASGSDRWSDADALRDAVGRDTVLLYVDHAGEAFIVHTNGVPAKSAARVDFIAVAPDKRRLGIGGRAALALEKRVMKSRAQIYVAVPSTIGLALYFWLRLGYRPLTKHEWPAPLSGTSVWMVRERYNPPSSSLARYSRSERPK